MKTKSATVMNIKTQQNSISGEKQKKRVIVNLLDTPLDIQWPPLTNEQEEQVHTLLTEYLTVIRVDPSFSGQMLREIPKSQRSEWKKSLREKNKQEKIEKQKANCAFGLRDVKRDIEKGKVSLVICDKSPATPMLTKFLIPLCRTRSVPLLPVKQLNTTLSKVLKIPRCLTLALKKTVEEDRNPFHLLYLKLKGITGNIPITPAATTSSNLSCYSVVDEPTPSLQSSNEVIQSRNFLLKKIEGQRSFIPGGPNPLKTGVLCPVQESLNADVILFEPPSRSRSLTDVSMYKPMKIKRLQNNGNKVRFNKKNK